MKKWIHRALILTFLLSAFLAMVIVSVDYTYGHRREDPLAHSFCHLCQAFNSFELQSMLPALLFLGGLTVCMGIISSKCRWRPETCVLNIIAPRPPPLHIESDLV